jgi:hypothetical protein
MVALENAVVSPCYFVLLLAALEVSLPPLVTEDNKKVQSPPRECRQWPTALV